MEGSSCLGLNPSCSHIPLKSRKQTWENWVQAHRVREQETRTLELMESEPAWRCWRHLERFQKLEVSEKECQAGNWFLRAMQTRSSERVTQKRSLSEESLAVYQRRNPANRHTHSTH